MTRRVVDRPFPIPPVVRIHIQHEAPYLKLHIVELFTDDVTSIKSIPAWNLKSLKTCTDPVGCKYGKPYICVAFLQLMNDSHGVRDAHYTFDDPDFDD
jgi:hypothetical protein